MLCGRLCIASFVTVGSFSVVPYELVVEAPNDSEYASDYEEDAVFNCI